MFVLLPYDSLTCSSWANRLEYLLTQKWKNTRTRRKERFRGDAVIHSDLHPFKPKKCSSGFRIDFHQYEGKLGIPNQKVFRKYRLSAEAIYFFSPILASPLQLIWLNFVVFRSRPEEDVSPGSIPCHVRYLDVMDPNMAAG